MPTIVSARIVLAAPGTTTASATGQLLLSALPLEIEAPDGRTYLDSTELGEALRRAALERSSKTLLDHTLRSIAPWTDDEDDGDREDDTELVPGSEDRTTRFRHDELTDVDERPPGDEEVALEALAERSGFRLEAGVIVLEGTVMSLADLTEGSVQHAAFWVLLHIIRLARMRAADASRFEDHFLRLERAFRLVQA